MKVNGHDYTKEQLKESMVLYAITHRYWLKEGESVTDKVREAIRGGATFIQLREKNLSEDLMRKEAIEIKEICREYDVPFVINDDVMLAKELDADGVHVGQDDMKAEKVREILGPDKILGVSAQTVEEALLAQSMGADYLGVGAVFKTGSKDDARDVSHDTLQEIANAVDIPVIAIGGITKNNVLELKGRGIAGISVISAIFAQPDIEAAASELRDKVRTIVEE